MQQMSGRRKSARCLRASAAYVGAACVTGAVVAAPVAAQPEPRIDVDAIRPPLPQPAVAGHVIIRGRTLLGGNVRIVLDNEQVIGEPLKAQAAQIDILGQPDNGGVLVDAKAEVPPTLESALRWQLAKAGCTDKEKQDPIVQFVQTRDEARAALRDKGLKLFAAMGDAAITDKPLATMLNEFQAASEDEQAHTQAALEALNGKIAYKKQPRLETFLTLLGVLGDASPWQTSFTERLQRLGGPGNADKLLELENLKWNELQPAGLVPQVKPQELDVF